MSAPMMKCGHQANARGRPAGEEAFRPSCAICSCFEVADTTPDFTGRLARCGCGNTQPSTDHDHLAFFEYRGPGSADASRLCSCGYTEGAHGTDKPHLQKLNNHTFTPHGPYEFDTYYCGHAGWD